MCFHVSASEVYTVQTNYLTPFSTVCECYITALAGPDELVTPSPVAHIEVVSQVKWFK